MLDQKGSKQCNSLSGDTSQGTILCAKKVLWYLKGTINRKLQYDDPSSNIQAIQIRKGQETQMILSQHADNYLSPTCDYLFLLGDRAISWASSKTISSLCQQKLNTLIAICLSARLQTLAKELILPNIKCSHALLIDRNGGSHKRSKHITISDHYVWDIVQDGTLSIRNTACWHAN